MKLISGSGKRLSNNNRQAQTESAGEPVISSKTAARSQQLKQKPVKRPSTKRKKIIITICIVLGALLVLGGGLFAVIRWEVQPFYDMFFPRPDESILGRPRAPRNLSSGNSGDPDYAPGIMHIDFENAPLEELRNLNVITFLILGTDGGYVRTEGGGNTDVIMVASFDIEKSTIDIVSIPRDTIVNVPWTVKKINSIWAYMSNNNRGMDNADVLTMEATKEHFADFLGFYVDFWVRIDMAGFVALVDSLPGGGVRVNVPRAFRYRDPDLKMDVSLSAGEQVLNGMQALAFARYRGFSDGDFGRINSQQLIMKGLATQLLSRQDSVNLTSFADILLKYVKSDIDSGTLVRFGREAMKVTSDNIRFSTAPVTPYTVTGSGAGWYAYVNLDEWLEIVNEKLSPFYHDITPSQVSILTLGENNTFYVTDDDWQGNRSWGKR